MAWVEGFLSLYAAVSLVAHIVRDQWLISPFLLLYATGYGFFFFRSLAELRSPRPTAGDLAGPSPAAAAG